MPASLRGCCGRHPHLDASGSTRRHPGLDAGGSRSDVSDRGRRRGRSAVARPFGRNSTFRRPASLASESRHRHTRPTTQRSR